MRYFTKLHSNGTAHTLFRFEAQKKKILEEYWTPKGWQHNQDARIVGRLFAERDLDEIGEAHAQSLFPQAFGLPVKRREDSVEEVAVGKKKYFKLPEGFFDSSEEEQSKFIEKVIEAIASENQDEKIRKPK